MRNIPPSKKCNKCEQEKDSTSFFVLTKRESVYLQSWCKECVTKSRKVRDAKRSEARRQMREWADNHNPIPWPTLKGDRRGETHTNYPNCSLCWRKYMPELGCIFCVRALVEK